MQRFGPGRTLGQPGPPTPHFYRQGPGQPSPNPSLLLARPLTSISQAWPPAGLRPKHLIPTFPEKICIGQPLTSIGQPLTSLGQPLTSLGQTLTSLGQTLTSIGQTPHFY